MHRVIVSLDEHIEMLKRSKLPTVVTEGSDDYLFFRRIEESLSHYGVSLLPVGGRQMVIDLFRRRKELGRNDIVFFADLDMWVYSGVPTEYNHRKLLFTDGYSIENDIYRDGNLEQLLYEEEKRKFKHELCSIIGWFSFCIAKFSKGEEVKIAVHPNRILDSSGCVCDEFCRDSGFTGPAEPFYAETLANYKKLLRGKTLLQLLIRHLSYSSRAVKHSKVQLIEYATAGKGTHYCEVHSKIEEFFAAEVCS
ncbi:MAG: DUF4435 domain-containing protein [Methylocystis sp.]|uniref:DUF4435 domain-containing protein n=1 Tax=Methylocystis sp. TaxID=1911079 RepID=UPI00394BB6E0